MIKNILLLFFFNSFLFASDVIQKDAECTINWTKYTLTCEGISAEGQSRYAALLSAKEVAYRNLLQRIKGVRINSITTFENGMKKSTIITSVVQGAIRGGKVVFKYYDREKGYGIVKVRIDLIDDILVKILQTKISDNLLHKFLAPFFLYAYNSYSINDLKVLRKLLNDFKSQGNSKAVKFIKSIIYELEHNKITGIVIDARGIDSFNLALMPKIRDKNGKEIYPANYINDDEIISSHGLVDYEMGTFEEVKNEKRVATNPILIKAKGIYGKKVSDLVLTYPSDKILSRIDTYILEKGRIVILVDGNEK